MNTIGKKYDRPWGYYRTIELNNDGLGPHAGISYQIKYIHVNPNSKLSLQYHHYRDEHWTILSGNGIVQLNDEFINVSENDTISIKKYEKHRMINNEKFPIIFIEIQRGTYLGEDDIVRIEDDYGRNDDDYGK